MQNQFLPKQISFKDQFCKQ